MSLVKIIEFKSLGDDRGHLVALEGNRDVPFDIKRVYYITDTMKGVARGFHAHKNLIQVAICIRGRCKFIMDDGVQKEEVLMNNQTKGILIDKMQWHEMHDFSHDCILLVLASDNYEESDYIRNYDDFIKLAK